MYMEKIRELTGKANKEDKEIVEKTIEDFAEYVKAVVQLENSIKLARFRMEPEDFQQYITKLDHNRKIYHESCIVGIRLLNRLARLYDIDIIYNGPEDRIHMAEFVKKVIDEYWENRKQ